jgi:uncharacterized membrane protein AbrB (regulator of aidB expression)
MVAVMLFKLMMKSDWAIPKEINFLFQVGLGVMVGANYHPDMLPYFKKLFFLFSPLR